MAVTFLNREKTKAKPKAKPAAATAQVFDPIVNAVERMGELAAIIKAATPAIKEYEDLRKFVAAKIPATADANLPVVVKGDVYEVEFGAKNKQKAISDLPGLAVAMGDTFMKVAKVSLADVTKYLSPDEQAKFVTEDRTGPRPHEIRKR